MDKVSGMITRRLTAVGSKSEGNKAILCGDDGCEYTLYRKDMMSIDDPFFAPYDNRHVTVKGRVEQSREHTGICVDSLLLDDGTELVPQAGEQLPMADKSLSSDMPEKTVATKRLPRKLKKQIKKQTKKIKRDE